MNENNIQVNNRILGRVKWFNSKLGYGFVTSEFGNISQDYFIHWRNIEFQNNNCYICLFKNELVEFEVKDMQAINLSGPKRSAILVCTIGKSSKYLNAINKYSKLFKVQQLKIDDFKSTDNFSQKTLDLFSII